MEFLEELKSSESFWYFIWSYFIVINLISYGTMLLNIPYRKKYKKTDSLDYICNTEFSRRLLWRNIFYRQSQIQKRRRNNNLYRISRYVWLLAFLR